MPQARRQCHIPHFRGSLRSDGDSAVTCSVAKGQSGDANFHMWADATERLPTSVYRIGAAGCNMAFELILPHFHSSALRHVKAQQGSSGCESVFTGATWCRWLEFSTVRFRAILFPFCSLHFVLSFAFSVLFVVYCTKEFLPNAHCGIHNKMNMYIKQQDAQNPCD